jgi:histidine triad (HIT) family protein
MPSIFSQIIKGQIHCHKVYEDDLCLAFLDAFPNSYGHTLVIPKQEIDHWIDCPLELHLHLQMIARIVAKAIWEAVDCQRVGVMVDGRQVPHYHIHLIPILDGKQMHEKNCPTMNKIDFEEMALRIKSKIQN